MSDFNEKELLDWFDRFVYSDIGSSVNKGCVEGHQICQAYQQIVALIKKPEVTEKFIKTKAKELHDKLWDSEKKCGINCTRKIEIRQFIRSLFKEAK